MQSHAKIYTGAGAKQGKSEDSEKAAQTADCSKGQPLRELRAVALLWVRCAAW
jgi:hypothetical protein